MESGYYTVYEVKSFRKIYVHKMISSMQNHGSMELRKIIILRFSVDSSSNYSEMLYRLSYMERQNKWMTWGQLTQEMISHYRGQFLMQLFKVVLGLDVIGNPYGLVVGLTHGVESLFYEPIQV